MARRVLVADDTEDIRVLLEVVLGSAGFDVVGVAEDGDEALRLWHGRPEDGLFAVILDQRMPGLTGLEVARAVLEEAPDQRVVLFSAHLDDELRAEALAAGVSGVVAKEELPLLPQHPALAG